MFAALAFIASVRQSPVTTANDFLASLSPAARAAAVLPFEDEYRTLFRFTPAARKGAFVGDLSANSRAKADAWLGAHLSSTGLKQVETIRLLEDVLRAQENNPGRDKALYAYTFFGKPTQEGTWGWRYEGHHLSLNYTYEGGKMVSSSPQFLGSNPAEVRTGNMKGTRVLAAESDLAFQLLNSLSDSQRKTAILNSRTLRSLNGALLGFATNNDRIARIEGKEGLAYSAMDKSQQAQLKRLVEEHANVQNESEARNRLSKIEKAGWNEVVFAWMGSTSPKSDHYYRIQGPTFLIEFDNAQDNTNHIHSVWRDFKGDFGRDVLEEHYAHSPHHRH